MSAPAPPGVDGVNNKPFLKLFGILGLSETLILPDELYGTM